ncbi:shikimate dehydrogenase family protein [Aliihoeflea sp. PC F10.4]
MIRLGLIGDNIARSQSPRLHRLAGRMCGLEISYEPLIPADLGLDFADVFENCRTGGFQGINVTYPYKEVVVGRLRIDEPLAKALGACNTVLFQGGGPRGFNTDCTGFASAFENAFGKTSPGRVAMAGAGGVGKAIAFALGKLGATSLAVFDPDRAKAEALAASLKPLFPQLFVTLPHTLAEAVENADGVINSTPLGMVGHPGSAFADLPIERCRWAFDAVYTPVETQFLKTARAAGVEILSGYELFFYQGVHAFSLFTGYEVDERALRAALLEPETFDRVAS